MKTLFVILFAASVLTALAQSSPTTTNSPPAAVSTNAPSAQTASDAETADAAREASRTLTTPKTSAEFRAGRATTGGAVVQATKSKKPWNLINPFAPMSAGDGTNNLVPNSAGGPPGLNIWSCTK